MAGNPRKECERVGQNFIVRTPRQASQLPGTFNCSISALSQR